ncbi:transcriptional regulator ATRX homolog [Ixodes scapularis]
MLQLNHRHLRWASEIPFALRSRPYADCFNSCLHLECLHQLLRLLTKEPSNARQVNPHRPPIFLILALLHQDVLNANIVVRDLSSLSSEEEMGEESAPTIVPSTKLVENGNEACRRALLEEALLGSSGDSEEDDGEGEPKKQKAVPKEKEDVVPDCEEEEAAPEKEEDRQEAVPDSDEEDSDEIGVATKKGKKLLKYEKLLQKPVPGGKDDSSEEEEPLESRKRKSKSKRVVVSSEDEHKYADSKKPELTISSSLGSSSSSESDNLDIEPARKKKKKQASSSIGSSGQSDDSDFNSSKKGKRGPRDGSASPGKAIKKKRRRIKMAASTDDDKENSDDSNSSQETGNKSRKNLRKLRPVGDETRAAAKAEEERKKRVQERQKLQYNKIRGGASECGNTTLEELVLEMDLKANEPLVTVNRKLVKCMKPHQVDGVKFLYECTIESLEMLKKDPNNGSGCILAHCMGLGKTFQVISFLHTVLNHKDCGKILRTALVVCPYNTVLNWSQEFERWLKDKGLDLTVHEVSSIKDNHSRVKTLEYWQKKGGVMIIGYDMFRRLTNEKARGVSKKIKERLRKALLDPGPDIVVCDEGHILKSDKTSLSIAMNSLRTCRRIVLSGTPLQNNLQECEFSVKFEREGSVSATWRTFPKCQQHPRSAAYSSRSGLAASRNKRDASARNVKLTASAALQRLSPGSVFSAWAGIAEASPSSWCSLLLHTMGYSRRY